MAHLAVDQVEAVYGEHLEYVSNYWHDYQIHGLRRVSRSQDAQFEVPDELAVPGQVVYMLAVYGDRHYPWEGEGHENHQGSVEKELQEYLLLGFTPQDVAASSKDFSETNLELHSGPGYVRVDWDRVREDLLHWCITGISSHILTILED